VKINFFTIVYNGMPFIDRHLKVFETLQSAWHWHLVEGVAALCHDTAWSKMSGGKIPSDAIMNTLSNDGTSEYLDEIKQKHPNQITIYRKTSGQLWDGKIEMVRAPIANIQEECLLWQIDVDELWTANQIQTMVREFERNPDKTAAWYWCNFYVGPEAVVSTRNCYSQNPSQEWLRTWNFKPGDRWMAHEPPTLVRILEDGSDADLGKINSFLHNETEKLGAVFDHLAYVEESQVAFKEQYYGYAGAIDGWRALQDEASVGKPILLSKYFPWVKDSTYVQPIGSDFVSTNAVSLPMVLVDGLAFQDPWNPGICRVWTAVLEYWVNRGWGKYVSVLDRGNTFPEISGINRIVFPRWDVGNAAGDSLMLQNACYETRSEVFISTLHTVAAKTPSVALIHDFIPEKLGVPQDNSSISDKRLAVMHATRAVCVSESTRNDLLEYFPALDTEAVKVAHLGVTPRLFPRSVDQINGFREKHQITKPYFLLVGERVGLLSESPPAKGYKNAKLVFEALSIWEQSPEYDLVIVGGASKLEEELIKTAPSIKPIMVRASEEELATAYSEAVALIYPSKYEGFGLPVAEAMKCGCPVITSNISSLPEVGGSAPIYIDPNDVYSLIKAMKEVIKPSVREVMLSSGFDESRRFQWDALALVLQESLHEASRVGIQRPELWSTLSESRAHNETAINAIKELEAEIRSIKGSLSWKYTAPLRWLDSIMRGYLKKKQSLV